MTPPPPGQQATAERHAALAPVVERVFPIAQCDFTEADRHGFGCRPPSWRFVA